MKDEIKDLPATSSDQSPEPMADAIDGDVFRDTETGELFMIKSSYDITHFDIVRVWSPNKPDASPETATRIPIGHQRLSNFVRMVEDIGA